MENMVATHNNICFVLEEIIKLEKTKMNRIFILLINCKNITLGIALIKKSVTIIVSWLALVYAEC